jgi:hypothetical protein
MPGLLKQDVPENGGHDPKLTHRMDFFSLDETSVKLAPADWLDSVVYIPRVADSLKRQNHLLNSKIEYDSLLKSAFEFIDVNDSAAANKILEESAATHSKRVEKRALLRHEDPRFASGEAELQ